MTDFSKNDELERSDILEEEVCRATDHSEPLDKLLAQRKNLSITADILKDIPAIEALEKQWLKLEKQCCNSLLFQSFYWCKNFIEFARQEEDFKPCVITLHEDKTLVGVLPLSLQNKKHLSVLTGLTEPFQQYTDVMLHPKTELHKVSTPLMEALKKSGADYIHLGQVRFDSALEKILGDQLPSIGESDAAPYVDIDAYADHASYLQTVRSKTRKNLRNARNRLEREAPVEHKVERGGGTLLNEVATRAFEGREAWLEQLGITSRAFQDETFKAFLDRFATQSGASKKIDTIAMSLTHGDNILSDQWGFIFNGRYYAFMANWNPEYEANSPGRLHLGEVIKTCFEQGFETADFLIPASSYKLTWADKMIRVSDRVLPLTFKGWIHARLWLDIIRPRAKRLFFRLPTGFRKAIIKMV